ncbi:hypothetical protein QUF50_06735 [Thiotrichales bacterium HSG1]|nr:hypothetical protein [Thiotrichales bacterium HSG1]
MANSIPNLSLGKSISNLQFIDTDVFDQKLLDSMLADTQAIEVGITGNISINNMPQRLGKWLSVVEKKDGKISLEPKSNSRSIGLILSFLPTIYYFLKEELTYQTVGNYNATIFRDLKTGKIDKIIFIGK